MKGEPEGIRDIRDDESLMDFYLDHRSVEKSTKRDYQKSWNKFQRTLNELGYGINELQRSDVKEMLDLWEDDPGISEGKIHKTISNLSRMADWCITEAGVADHNPFNNFIGSYSSFSESDTEKLDIPIEKLRKLVLGFENHRVEVFVFIVILLKTGLRHSEALNLDLRDINLDHPVSRKMPKPRQEVYNHPDSLYVDSEVSEGEIHNGERRAHGNKLKSSRKVPIDRELKSLLVWWIRMLPPSYSDAKPLLRVLNDPEHKRPTRGFTKPHIREVAYDFGVNGQDMTHFGFDAHWCRHWFTTQLRSRIEENEIPVGTVKEYVQGLRGDTGDDIINTYTHNWSVATGDKKYREVYEDNIPLLLVDN